MSIETMGLIAILLGFVIACVSEIVDSGKLLVIASIVICAGLLMCVFG